MSLLDLYTEEKNKPFLGKLLLIYYLKIIIKKSE
jgi:hypothetical protein